MPYMQFKFIQQTNSDDADYEGERTEGLVKRILGAPKVPDFELIQVMPEGWMPGDPIPGE